MQYIRSLSIALLVSLFSSYGFTKSFYVDLDVNTDSNSNVFLDADNDNSKSVSDTQHQASVGAGFDFYETDNSDARMLFSYFTERFVENDIDSQFISASLPYSLYISNYRFKLTSAYMQYRTDNNPALGYISASFDINRKFEKIYHNIFLGANYKYTQKTSLNDSFDDYAGHSHNAMLVYSVRWARSSLRTRLGYYENSYFNENDTSVDRLADEFSEDLISSVTLGENKSHSGSYFSASYRAYLKSFTWALSGRIKSYEYDANAFDGSVRKDTNFSFGSSLEYHFNRSTDMYARTEYTINNSNMETSENDRNYDQWVNSIGIRFHF